MFNIRRAFILIDTQSFNSDLICISYRNPWYKVTPGLPQKQKDLGD